MKNFIFSVTIFLVFLFSPFSWSEEIESNWIGPTRLENGNLDYNWGNTKNWEGNVPNNDDNYQYIANIPEPKDENAEPVNVNSYYTINSLKLYGKLKISTGNIYNRHWLALDKNNATSIINGTIYINDTSSNTEDWNNAYLYINNNHTFTGNGHIFFSTPNENKILGKGYLTIEEGLTIKTKEEGNWGEIGVNLTNNGLISADNGGILLSNSQMINNGLINGVNGGSLEIKNTLTNTDSGRITADRTSKLIFTEATVENSGIINTDHGSLSELYDSTIKTIEGGEVHFKGDLTIKEKLIGGKSYLISDGGEFVLEGKTTIWSRADLYLKGKIINNGEIVLEGKYNNLFRASLNIQGDVTIDGKGSIKFGTVDGNSIQPDGNNSLLTIGANQIIIAEGKDKNNNSYAGNIFVGFTNNGVISANNYGKITLEGADKINKNLIEAKNNGYLILKNISLTNTNAELLVDDTSTMELINSKIIGGTVKGDGLIKITNKGMLDGESEALTIEPTLEVSARRTLSLQGSIINNGEIVLEGKYSFPASLNIQGDVTIDGKGSIKFGTASGNKILPDSNNGGHLTIGVNQLITADAETGGSIRVPTTLYGTIQANGGTLNLPKTLTNNGLIRSANGSTLDIKNSVDGSGSWQADGGTLNIKADVTTTGKIEIKNNGKLKINGVKMSGSDLIMDNTAAIEVNSEVVLSGDFSFAMTDENKWQWGENSVLKMNGNSQALEVGGEDLGLDTDGFSNNFDLKHLIINGNVYLTDFIDNGNRHSNEALYVYDLNVLEGAILNLNGINLYTMYDEDGDGSLSPYLVKAGDGYKFGGGMIVNTPVPLPSSIYLLVISLLGLVALKRRY